MKKENQISFLDFVKNYFPESSNLKFPDHHKMILEELTYVPDRLHEADECAQTSLNGISMDHIIMDDLSIESTDEDREKALKFMENELTPKTKGVFTGNNPIRIHDNNQSVEKPLKILVGHEESQAVTIQLRRLGHEAYSCDLKNCSGGHPEWHLKMDVFKAIALKKWDVGIFFPDCTYLTISAEWAYKEGPYHQKVKPETLVGKDRCAARIEAVSHVKALWNCGIEKISIENPVGRLSTLFMKPTQTIHPYQFGEDASKRTCLWLKGLPSLKHTKYIEPRIVNGKKLWGNQTDSGQNKLPPSKNRAELRSKTYEGIAMAMAQQWTGENELTLF